MTDKNVFNSQKIRLMGITMLYFLGVLTGVVLYSFPPLESGVFFISEAEEFVLEIFNKSFSELLIDFFSEPFLMLLVCFALGLSAIAHPMEYMVVVFHGFSAGIMLAGVYDVYNIKGVSICAIMIIPWAVISAFTVIIAVREALNMSTEIYVSSFGKKNMGAKIDFRLYFNKYIILCVIAAMGAFLESVIVFLAMDFWGF